MNLSTDAGFVTSDQNEGQRRHEDRQHANAARRTFDRRIRPIVVLSAQHDRQAYCHRNDRLHGPSSIAQYVDPERETAEAMP